MANQSLTYELDAVMPEANLTGYFSKLVTFKDRPGGANPVRNSSGQIDLTNLVNVPGLINIPCQLAVQVEIRPNATGGARLPENFVETSQRHILLNGYYPQILQRYIAVVDGVQYEITPGAVEHFSQNRQTRLAVRFYSQ